MIYRFGPCRLDTDRLEYWRGPDSIAVEPQVFELLVYLIENRDRVVSKDDLIASVWAGRIVSDATLSSRINAARRAVDDDGKEQAVIRTFPRRGFRFVAEVFAETDASAADHSLTDVSPAIPGSLQLPENPSIVVLPFKNLSDDAEQEYFSDGITEDITTALSSIRWLFVIARNSAFAFKEQSRDVREVASELGVRYVLEGSVRRFGDRVRIAAQLVDGTSGRQVWGNRYDHTLADIFDVQDRLTETIIGAIEPELGRAEQQRARSKKTDNLDAWDIYQQGMWHLYRRGKADLANAHACFDKALALDPQLSVALTGAVDAYYYEIVLGHADNAAESRISALELARQALAIDPDDAAVHNAMGKARIVRREHDEAIPDLELALELNPSLAWAHYGMGAAMIFSGRAPDHTIKHIQRAIRLSPRDAHMSSFMVRMADAFLAKRDYAAAVDWARKALREPGFQWSRYTVLLSALGHMGDMDAGQRILDELHAQRPDISVQFVQDWHLYMKNETFAHYLDGLRAAGMPA